MIVYQKKCGFKTGGEGAVISRTIIKRIWKDSQKCNIQKTKYLITRGVKLVTPRHKQIIWQGL
jgi:hypothetical protein